MAKKKKAKGAPKKAQKKAAKKPAKAAKKPAKKKKAAKKPTVAKKKATKRLDGLRARFIGSKARRATPAARGRASGSTPADAAQADAEAAVLKAHPDVKIVKPAPRRRGDAARNVTVQGVPLRSLKQKYVDGVTARELADADAIPPTRSQIVYTEPIVGSDDASAGPKARIVRDGQERSLQG